MSIEELQDELEVEDIEQVDDEVIEEQDTDDDNEPEPEPSEDAQDDDEADSQDDDWLEFSLDEPSDDKDPFAGQEAPEWVKQVRKENRELKRQLKERESQQPEQKALREKPTLDDHDWNDETYEADLEKWYAEKAEHEAQVQAEQAKYRQYDERYNADADAVKAKVPNYNEIEQSIVDVLPATKQGLIKIACKNPARVVVALGKSPDKLDELAKMNDVEFAYTLGQMEMQMSNVKRNKAKPKPKTHSLQGSAGGGADTQLAKLEAEAAKTGDRSKIIAYRKSQRKN